MTTIAPASDLLALSAERDAWQRVALVREREAWRQGWRACWAAAYAAGRQDEAAEREEAWRRNSAATVAAIWPDSPHGRESARRRVCAAEAGCRRDAAEHWREFFERAWATPPHKRTETQLAAVALSRSWREAGAA